MILDLSLPEFEPLQPEQDLGPPPLVPVVEPEQPLQEEQQKVQQPVRCSTRVRRPPARHANYVPNNQIAFEAIMEPQPDAIDQQLKAFMVSSIPDVLYLWQAMKEPDWPQVKAAMQCKIEEHQNNGHWETVLQSSFPKSTPVLPKRKHRTRGL